MRIGAHVSNAGGLEKAVDRAVDLGAETFQCFCSSPRGWAFKPVPKEQSTAFLHKAEAAGVGPAFLHGIYLVNLGTNDQEMLRKGIQSLINYMGVASAIGGAGVIFHVGSHKGAGYEGIFQQTVDSLKEVLAKSPQDILLIIENSAGMGNHIGSKFAEIGRIMQAVNNQRLKVCLDTQHCFAAGYDILTPEGVDRVMEEFDHEVGLDNLVVIHANDSKVALAAGVDRHENLGEGHMGLDAFVAIMGHPALRDIPLILEVPGFEKNGPDKQNIDILKEIRSRAGL